MRSGRGRALAALAAAMFLAAGTAVHANSGAVVESAQGGYHWTLPEDVIGFEVVARTTANVVKLADGSVQGEWIHHQEFLGQVVRLVVRATCMEIYEGNRAKIGGVIEVSNDPDVPAGVFAWFQAVDGGEGADAPPDVTTFVGIGTEAENEAYCASPEGPRFGPFEVTGNLQVRQD